AWAVRFPDDLDQLDTLGNGRFGTGDGGERPGERFVAALAYAECDRAAAELGNLGDQFGRQADGAAALECFLEALEQNQAVLLFGGEAEQLDAGAQVLLRAGHGEPLDEARQQ